MKKYLVTIEFRYSDIPLTVERGSSAKTKTVTIGVYDSFDEASINGNKLLEKLEKEFPPHVFPDGRNAVRERFSKNGGCFGTKNTLVTNLAYLTTPFQFFAKITTLNYTPVEEAIEAVLDSVKRYRECRDKVEDNETW